MSAHTPTPWRVIAGDDYYITADGYPSEFIGHFKGDDMGPYLALVGNRPKDFGEANAALIVRAVNRDHHFDALVKALEGLLPWLEDAETKCLVGDEGCVWAVEHVRDILASVGGA